MCTLSVGETVNLWRESLSVRMFIRVSRVVFCVRRERTEGKSPGYASL